MIRQATQNPARIPVMHKKYVTVGGKTACLTSGVFVNQKGGVRLALAGLEDAKHLSVLEQATFNDKIYDRLSRRSMRHMIKDGNGAMILAWKDDRLCGYALVSFKRNSHKAHFESLAVMPVAQGMGIGSILFKAAEQAARAAGADTMILEIRADNKRLKTNYLEKGYRITHECEGYYPDGCASLKFSGAL
jgi:ribosomal protein S18 acetylase RimI-like enzyme